MATAPHREHETPDAAAPASAADPQVLRLAESARELRRVIRAANGLPSGFPEDEILALADALQEAPEAEPRDRLVAAVYVRERFVDCRRRFVSEAPDDPDLPGIDAIARAFNDTIAELSTLVVAAGREAEASALPDRAGGTSIVAIEAAGADVIEVQRRVDDATQAAQQVEAELQAVPQHVYIDQSRHYHFFDFRNSGIQLKLPIKMTGAIFEGELLDRAWLDKMTAVLEKARDRFKSAWDAAKGFLQYLHSLVDAVRRLGREVTGVIDKVRQIVRRLFPRRAEERLPGAVFRDVDAPWCPEMVVIPAGSFLMGSPEGEKGRNTNESPQHEVSFARPFALGRFPVTFDEYDHFCEVTGRGNPGDWDWGRRRRPVINVSWEDAQAYCEWLSEVTGQRYRLPSEAEWEYACRAGTTTPFSTGATITTEQANYGGGQRRGQTTPVDTFPANPWGLHDMHGNVWEWCEDRWHNSYRGAPADGSSWLKGKESRRVVRGGSWDNYRELLSSAVRDRYEPISRYGSLGFRMARTVITLESLPLGVWGEAPADF